jgi:hypothetical protein
MAVVSYAETLFGVGSEPGPSSDGGAAARLYRESSRRGKLAEQLAIVELLERGHSVALPVVDDDGVDLVVNYRLRVQVKSCQEKAWESVPGYPYRGFSWSVKPGRKNKADVFLFYGRLESGGRWFVVPVSILRDVASVVNLYVGSRRGLSAVLPQYENRWELFDGE